MKSSTDSSQPPVLRTAEWAIPVSVILVVYAILFVLMPYSEGYLGGRMPVFKTAYNFWNTEKNWGHGIFVPPIVVAMIWFRRKQLAQIPCQGANSGIVIVAVALLVYWLGFVVDHHYVGFISAQILVAGLIVWFLGWRMMKALIFEWTFLTFTWPFLFLDTLIAFPLRMVLSELAYNFLNTIGIESVKMGSSIVSAPNPQLGIPSAKIFAIDIADPCSGMHSLFAMLMVGAIYVHFAITGFWKKWFIFLCSIPIAVFGNFCRILILVFGTMMFGTSFAIGTIADPSLFHDAAGFFVFGVGLIALMGVSKLLSLDWLDLWRNLRKSTAQARPDMTPEKRDGKPVSGADIY